MVLDYRKSENEEQMLMNLHKKSWTSGLKTAKYEDHSAANEKTVKVPPPPLAVFQQPLPTPADLFFAVVRQW
jgi:hypothetical protein